MSTDVLERPDLKDADTSDEDNEYHYVRKEKILQSAIEGTPVKALCGAIFTVTKASKKNSKVCPQCEEIYKNLPAGK